LVNCGAAFLGYRLITLAHLAASWFQVASQRGANQTAR
jgi:hypothetical protein